LIMETVKRFISDCGTVEVTEIFAFLILVLILILSAANGISVTTPIIRETIVVCLFVLFGSEYMKMRGKK